MRSNVPISRLGKFFGDQDFQLEIGPCPELKGKLQNINSNTRISKELSFSNLLSLRGLIRNSLSKNSK